MTYTPIYGQDTKLQDIVRSDGANIPIDPQNSDYQKALVDNGGPFPATGIPTFTIKPKTDATMLQEFKALSNASQQALTSDLLTRLLLQNPDIATKYGLTVTQ